MRTLKAKKHLKNLKICRFFRFLLALASMLVGGTTLGLF